MTSTLLRRFAVLGLAATAAACAQGNAEPIDAATAPNVVTITAAEYGYQAPATLPAGLTTVRLVNAGHELHHAQLVRLDAPHTVQELLQGLAAHQDGPPPPWVHFVGGPNTPAPGATTQATLDLKAGTYAILCFVPDHQGVPHVAKGMVKELTVTQAGPDLAAEPRADVSVKLTDYAFGLSGDIAAGTRTLRVQNDVAQPHEIILVQLAPGKTVNDMAAWLATEQGPPPGRPMGGTALLGTGEVNYVTADFPAGNYALLCMVPDAHDGKPHIAHGMMRQITVR